MYPTIYCTFLKFVLAMPINTYNYIFSIAFQSVEEILSAESGLVPASAQRKGLLWQQRDKLFSRWKERYFVLTKEYFHCFKKGSTRLTEMGGFIFKVRRDDRLAESMKSNNAI